MTGEADAIPGFSDATTQVELATALVDGTAPISLDIDTSSLNTIILPEELIAGRIVLLGSDLILIQGDGSIAILRGGSEQSFLLDVNGLLIPSEKLVEAAERNSGWVSFEDIPVIPPRQILDPNSSTQSSGENVEVRVGDPLEGLFINPLLPPVNYRRPLIRDEEYFGSSAGTPQGEVEVLLTSNANLRETDADLPFAPSDFVDFNVGFADVGDAVSNVTFTLSGLPVGTTSTAGDLSDGGDGSLTLLFSGGLAEFQALTVNFPRDFSSESRVDFAEGPLAAVISVDTVFQGSDSLEFPVAVRKEGDVEISEGDDNVPDETDAPTPLVPSELLFPEVTDIDGSEAIVSLTLTVAGLPGGITLVELGFATPDGATASISVQGDGSSTLIVEMSNTDVDDIPLAYSGLNIELPTDFSTANRNDLTTGATELPISLNLFVQTDEDAFAFIDTDSDGTATFTRDVDIGFELDVTLEAQELIEVEEDGGFPATSVGVDVPLRIFINVTDQDGSETDSDALEDAPFAVQVVIEFDDLPTNTDVNGGTLIGNTWTGTVTEAEALVLELPEDFAGEINSVITAVSPEGEVETAQRIVVTPTPDVEITGEVEVVETDLAEDSDGPITLEILLSDFVQIDITDADGDEEIQTLTFTLPGLPDGTTAEDENGPAGAIVGGTLTYTFTAGGGQAVPDTLTLFLPGDYSTESPPTTLTGTLSVMTDDVYTTTAEIPVVVLAEGDLEIALGTDNVPDETDAVTPLIPSELLTPQVTDADGSESLASLTLTIFGLPGEITDTLGSAPRVTTVADLLPIVPSGVVTDLSIATDGSATLEITMETPAVADIAGAYSSLELELPQDFSTANRSDLTGSATTLPIELTLSVVTDEDRDLSVDTATDGQATQAVVIDIGFELDVTIDADLLVQAAEDGGVPDNSDGVSVDLGIDIAVTDLDGSETASEAPEDAAFAVEVTIVYTGLPDGTTFSEGTLVGNTWTGTVGEANDLQINLPGDYNGNIISLITATSPEGVVRTPQVISIAPTPDVVITGEVIVTETDLGTETLNVLLSDFIEISIDPNNETIQTLNFTLPGLPDGTTASDGAGPLTGAVVGGVFTYNFTAGSGQAAPDTVVLSLPGDYSSTSPADTLTGVINVQTDVTNVTDLNVPFTVNFEGDVTVDVVDGGQIDLAETDAVVTFLPSSVLQPRATDADGSENVLSAVMTFNALPSGTRFSVDGGPFEPAEPTLNFIGTLDQYNSLIIELPADFSTENPATDLTGTLVVLTDENGTATETMAVVLSAEGDIEVTGPGAVTVEENDPELVEDEDDTSTDPLDVLLSEVVSANPSDDDDSEEIAVVDVSIGNLPTGTLYSLDGGTSFEAPINSGTLDLDNISFEQYEDLLLRLPDDYSNEGSPIAGTVTFTTDEAILAGEDTSDPDDNTDDGIASAAFEITVTSEQDVNITTSDVTVDEDTTPSTSIPLNISAEITDIDGSENLTGITVAFSDLPDGTTTLSDGTTLTGPTADWTGTSFDDLSNLAITDLPTHYSGIIEVKVTVETDEGTGTGASETFLVNVNPIAEPTIELSVDDSMANVDELGDGNFIVDEDSSFSLLITAQTPDLDGSEYLTQIVISNVPAGWAGDTDGPLDLSIFTSGRSEVASATLDGTTITIELANRVSVFDGAIQLSPLPDNDRDVFTILADEIKATVTSQDMADGLTTDVQTATAEIDIDVDAIVDDATIDGEGVTVDENTDEDLVLSVNLTEVSLNDNDGSETISSLELTISVATESDPFDPASNEDLLLEAAEAASAIEITQTASTDDSVTYSIEPADGATIDQVTQAIESLQITLPQHFSGVLTFDGKLDWNETTTGDVEDDTSDNFNTGTFTFTSTVNPVAQADLSAAVFVLTDPEVADDSPTRVEAMVQNGSISGAEILTLLESTGDGSGPGQVSLFVGIDVETPDTDSSEQLDTVVIENVPTDWIADFVSGGVVQTSALLALTGSDPLDAGEVSKVDQMTFDAGDGTLSISFVPGVTSFEASLQLQPTLYEDYDVDRDDEDPFTAAGNFFADDLNISVNSSDGNTATDVTADADATLDVDVDPVNNIAMVVSVPEGIESEIDAAGGVWNVSFEPTILDTDGSETITAVVLNEIPSGVTVFVIDPDDPDGPRIPALLTDIDPGDEINAWSLENGQWEDVEFRGIPIHFAGTVVLSIDIVTTEADGGNTRVTTLDEPLTILPVIDGGEPGGTTPTDEDTAIFVPINGNLIDNPSNSPESPEAIQDLVIISRVQEDSFGRFPDFFAGEPLPDDSNRLPIDPEGVLRITAVQAENLWVRPGQDSNEDIEFDATVTYFETIDEDQTLLATGTVTVTVQGIADNPTVTVQNPDQSLDPDFATFPDTIDDSFQDVVDADKAYGYAGLDGAPFDLTQHLSNDTLENGYSGSGALGTIDADLLGGSMTEITNGDGEFDGSETLYYVITGVDPSVSFLGASPGDETGTSYVLTEAQLANLQFVPVNVPEVTVYDMTLTAIVVEDDEDGIFSLTSTEPEDILVEINELPGGAAVSEEFAVIVVPTTGDGPPDCTPEQNIGNPVLTLVGRGDEDTQIPLKLQLTPDGDYQTLEDIFNLPNDVEGDVSIAITLPDGASLNTDPPGGVLLDPVTGNWVVDLATLGIDPDNPTQTEGSILFTPPEHESSPVNPFDFDETFGDEDPYDNLTELEFEITLNNVTCDTITTSQGMSELVIDPVVDGPTVSILGDTSFPEDTVYNLNIDIQGVDGGERPFGNVIVEVDSTNGGQLLDSDGEPLLGVETGAGTIRYELASDDLAGLGISAAEHYSGPLTVSVTATAEDINFDTASVTETVTLNVIPVADVPVFEFDDTVIDPDTDEPFIDLTDPNEPVITAIEDIPFFLNTVIQPDTPDQDGSEVATIVLSGVPDFLDVSGPSSSGFIDNGDGSFTIAVTSWPDVSVLLVGEHARTPDALMDPAYPAQIPLTIAVNTLELANADEGTGELDFVLQVRADADQPTVTVTADPTMGEEDDPNGITLTIEGMTPDPHEGMQFEITVPDGGLIFVGDTPQPVVGDVVTLTNVELTATGADGSLTFAPIGEITFLPPEDFAGDTGLEVVAVSIDEGDTERSEIAVLDLEITATEDLVLTAPEDPIELDEIDEALAYTPSADVTIEITDTDGSEIVPENGATYTIFGVPDGTTYSVDGGEAVEVSGDLVFTGTEEEYGNLVVLFPADFATNGTNLEGRLDVITNEGGDDFRTFEISIAGEVDLIVESDPPLDIVPQTGEPLEIALGIQIDFEREADTWEMLEEIVVTFDTALPTGSSASDGTLSTDRTTLTLTRGALDNAAFIAVVTALTITVPGDYNGVLAGEVTGSTNHGDLTEDPAEFEITVNSAPEVTGPVRVGSTENIFVISNDTLLSNSSDPDTPLTLSDFESNDADVGVVVGADGVQITVPVGYFGVPILTYTVTDAQGSSTEATAQLFINDAFQMTDTGDTAADPDGSERALLSDVTGTAADAEFAIGTANDDAVVLSSARPYADIEGFNLLLGSDFIDLSASAQGFTVNLGSGDDWALGSSGGDVLNGDAGNDILDGGLGSDTLAGGNGADIFVLTDTTASDAITDYDYADGDQIDLTALVALANGEVIGDRASVNDVTGALEVDGVTVATINDAGGGIPEDVEVIFLDASNAQTVAPI